MSLCLGQNRTSKKIQNLLFALLCLCVFSSTKTRADDEAAKNFRFSQARAACSGDEIWKYSKEIEPEYRQLLDGFLAGSVSPALAVAEGIWLQKNAKSPELKLFGVYLKYRALYAENLVHIATSGFNWLAGQPLSTQTIGVQTAALQCLNKIESRYPRLRMEPEVTKLLPEYREKHQALTWFGENQDVVWEAAGRWLRALFSEDGPENEIEQALSVLRDGGPHELLASGLQAGRKREFDVAIQKLSKFVQKSKELPPSLTAYMDGAYITLARSYYQTEKYTEASDTFQKVSKGSNEMVRVLNEQTWVNLMKGRYPEALGSALSLQGGGLRTAFSPESLVVMSMSYNELCQYPTAFRTLRLFHRNYRPAFSWLRDWYFSEKKKASDTALYTQLVKYLETEKSRVPKPVLSEWLRSPVFVSYQEEINLLFDEQKASENFTKKLKEEFVKLRELYQKMANKVKSGLADAKEARKKGEQIDDSFKTDLEDFKRFRRTFTHYKDSLPSFKKILASHDKRKSVLTNQLVTRIDRDLKSRNARMIKRLRHIAETAYLVQVEIFNGASEDIVWKNAHPEYKEFLSKLKDERSRFDSQHVWDWGPAPELEDGSIEVWEDELGALKAAIFNNCSSKDRFLANMHDEEKEASKEESENTKKNSH